MEELRRTVLNSNEIEDVQDLQLIQRIFMYVKNYCRYSKRAAAEAVKYCDDVRCIDMVEQKPIDPISFEQIDGTVDVHLLQAFKMKNYPTVPQIFVYDTKWKYVGGCKEFMAIADNSSVSQMNIHRSLARMKL